MRKEDLYTTTIQGLPVESTNQSSLPNSYSLFISCAEVLKAKINDGNGRIAFAKDGDEISLEKLLCVIQCFLID